MVRVKAQYTGERAVEPKVISKTLHGEFKNLYVDHFGCQSSDKSIFDDADDFASELIIELEWLVDEMAHLQLEPTFAQRKAEVDDLLSYLHGSLTRLKSMSPNVESLLHSGAGPLPLVKELESFIPVLAEGGAWLASFEDEQKATKSENISALTDELTNRLILIFEAYGIKPTATADRELRADALERGKDLYQSFAITILTVIDKELRLGINTSRDLESSPESWRNRLGRVKNKGATNK